MLKVNNKAVIAKLRAAAIAPFEPERYDPMSDARTIAQPYAENGGMR